MSICSGKKLAKFEVRKIPDRIPLLDLGKVSDRLDVSYFDRDGGMNLCLSQLRVCSLCQSDKSDLLNSAICLWRGVPRFTTTARAAFLPRARRRRRRAHSRCIHRPPDDGGRTGGGCIGGGVGGKMTVDAAREKSPAICRRGASLRRRRNQTLPLLHPFRSLIIRHNPKP